MNAPLSDILFVLSVWALPAVVAITLHEAAHGFVAWRLGDDTAYRLGRVSFNPLRHVDPVGTVLIPLLLLLSGSRFLFGWAKPVPVNFAGLRHPRRDMVWVAAAGPLTNIALALVSGYLVHVAALLPRPIAPWAQWNLQNSIAINAVLAVFNMLPLPPLDGGRVAVGLLPRTFARPLARLEPWGLFILIGFLFIVPLLGRQLGVAVDLFHWLVGGPVRFVIETIRLMTGIS